MKFKSIAAAMAFITMLQLPATALAEKNAAASVAPDYDAVASLLKSVADREIAAKNIPSLSYAIVDSNGIRLFGASGFADKDKKVTPTADSIYRAGSVSKLFTDILVMQLVEEGKLDLDAPVTTFLPTFRPHNPFGTQITLRQLMTHRSGLVREPPVGSYFDASEPSLKETVDSLNSTTLVAAPGSFTKYSNGAIAVVGRVLETVTGKPYEQLARERILAPLGMSSSSFSRENSPPAVYAEMGSYDGPRFDAPAFDLGTPSAGSLYTSANDLAKFARILLRRGSDGPVSLIDEPTLNQMWTPQYGVTVPRTFGLGFILGNIDGHRTVGHTGGIYGFITNFMVLPDDDTAVITFGALDDNMFTRRFAQYAAKVMLAAKAGQPLPAFQHSDPVGDVDAARLKGLYRHGDDTVLVKRLNGRSLVEGAGRAAELRRLANGYVLDDATTYDDAIAFSPDRQSLTLGGITYLRAANERPADASAALKSAIGEYGPDHNLLRIYEQDGKPWVRIEWTGWQQMRIVDADHWAFPDDPTGLYPKESLHLTRSAKGEVTAVDLNGIRFERRNLGAEALARVRASVRNLPNLKRDALAAIPPSMPSSRPSDLVEIAKIDPTIRLHINYATSDDFIGFPVYDQPRAFSQRPVAEALARVNRKLGEQGLGLTIHDAYRPWYVTKMFWDATPPESHVFVADPSQGSRHNRGAAVDLTLHELANGKPVEMTGWYDELSSRSYPQYLGGTSLQRWRRDLLRTAMEAEGFSVFDAEWWHFDYQNWREFPLSNQPFSAIR